VMMGYYKNRLATNNAFTQDGWLKTGDLGFLDKDNFLYLTGRSKSIILGSNGQNVYPEEIETKLRDIPYVVECMVRGYNDRIEALLFPDFAKAQADGINRDTLIKILVDSKKDINSRIPSYMHISLISVVETMFEKDSDNNIKRYLYQK